MRPLAEIVATFVDDEDHATAPVAIGVPFWSRPAALACAVCPTSILDALSVTLSVVSTGVGAFGVVGVESPPLPPQETERTAARVKRSVARRCGISRAR
jgi:hypothetical protein